MNDFGSYTVTQEMVPGQPIFVAVRDASHDNKSVKAVSVLSLGWLREDVTDKLNDSRYDGFDPIELYVLFPATGDFPKSSGLMRVDVGTVAGKEPGDGPRLTLTNEIGILWSCDL